MNSLFVAVVAIILLVIAFTVSVVKQEATKTFIIHQCETWGYFEYKNRLYLCTRTSMDDVSKLSN